MPKYTAAVLVEYQFDIEADSEQEAHNLAYYNYDKYSQYTDVYSVEIEESEEE